MQVSVRKADLVPGNWSGDALWLADQHLFAHAADAFQCRAASPLCAWCALCAWSALSAWRLPYSSRAVRVIPYTGRLEKGFLFLFQIGIFSTFEKLFNPKNCF